VAYREGRDPHEVAAEIWIEAQRREVAASVDKVTAERKVREKEAVLHMARVRHGALVERDRHVRAAERASAVARGEAPNEDDTTISDDVREAQAEVLRVEADIEVARGELAKALAALGEATEVRLEAESELRAFSG
jgi:hypothetical protein